MNDKEKTVVLYGCGWESEKFLLKYPDMVVEYYIDNKLYDREYKGFSVYKPIDKKDDLKSKFVIVFTKTLKGYEKISAELKSWGLREFDDYIPYNIYGKKIALTWGNCHVEYIKSYLGMSSEFSNEYAFYNKRNLWNMKSADEYADLFAHCDLLVCQHIREDNSLSSTFASSNIESMLKEGARIVKFPNMYGLPKFIFPQTYKDDMFISGGGGVQWYRDKNIDECLRNKIYDIEKIYEYVISKEYSKDEIMNYYFEFLEKMLIRERQCDIHILDYILNKLGEEQLFLDIEHPSKQLLGEIGNRILESMGYSRLKGNVLINDVYAHEVVTYPKIKEMFNMTWKDGDIKSDNVSEKLYPVYMDTKEYIKQYCMVYRDKPQV